MKVQLSGLGYLVLLLVGCSGGSADTQPDTLPTDLVADVALDSGPGLPACVPGANWAPGISIFVEHTSEWGLDGVQGTHLSVTDFDGDGWPDLIVRKGGGQEDFSPGGERNNWILRNTGDEHFEDVSQSSGVFASRQAPDPLFGVGGRVVASGDVNNDGYMDVYIGRPRTDLNNEESHPSEIMLNNGDGTYSLGPEGSAARFRSEKSSPAGASFVDYDRDGNLDLWVVHNELPGLIAMQDTLLKGDGTGNFVDVTLESGVGTLPWQEFEKLNEARAHSWGWGSAVCDLNNDGYPELLASSYGRAPNHLWRGIAGPEGPLYLNESIASGYASDHRTDWTTNLSAQCFCADQPAAEDCDQCPAPANSGVCTSLANAFGPNYRWNHANGREAFNLGGNSGTTVCADLNNDGHLDLMTHEIVHSDVGDNSDPSELLLNTGEAEIRFERPGPEATGITRDEGTPYWDRGDMTGTVFDFDNDGWQDVFIGSAEYAGTRGWLYRQVAPGQFEEIATDDFFLHYRAHGMTVADFDRDGDLDIIVGHSRFRCEGFEGTECMPSTQVKFFENIFGAQNNWLQVRLEGANGVNASAIGARVQVTAGGVTQTQEVEGGHGRFGLQRDTTLHFGLGTNCEAEVKVIWPDGARTSQTFSAHANLRYSLRAGDEAEVVP